MGQVRMRDVVVLLPGITGSVLQKDGKDLWAISGEAAWSALRTLGGSLQQLYLDQDDPEAPDLGDGITPVRVIRGFHGIPGLKIDGYRKLSRLISDNFDVVQGDVHSDRPANFFEFPYDWRRDVRAAAWSLKRLVDRRLPQWREHSGAADAKVILLAHSMGGIVARCYLELEGLEGWRSCRALVTFGTPYRGSVNVLNFLANGYKKSFVDLSEVLRSFTSSYQLLPTYAVLEVDGRWLKVAEADGIDGVVRGPARERAAAALAVHDQVNAAVERHLEDRRYRDAFQLLPIVGTGQPTLQSASLRSGRLAASRSLPARVHALLAEGDSTVPRLSAIPIELSDKAVYNTFIGERHSSLQNNSRVHDDLLERLVQTQVEDLAAIRGPTVSAAAGQRPAVSLELDDFYLPGEPVTLRATVVNMPKPPNSIRARVEPVTTPRRSRQEQFRPDGDGWALTLRDLSPGLYRLEVRATGASGRVASPIHDVFEVTG
jgi:pimeloyl-ACP methyl ester carboxylesterase